MIDNSGRENMEEDRDRGNTAGASTSVGNLIWGQTH
jgi:hypothetical protein